MATYNPQFPDGYMPQFPEDGGGDPAPGATPLIQADQQANYRTASGTATAFNGDAIAAFSAHLGGSAGSYNEQLILYLQDKLGSESTSLPSLMAAAAANRGRLRWQEVTNPPAVGT